LLRSREPQPLFCSCRLSASAGRQLRLALDLVGFPLLLIFVLASSVIGLTRASVTAAAT
jgi:hypothetical protein